MKAIIKGFNSEEDFLTMKEVCNNISKKDNTFHFTSEKLLEDNKGTDTYIITIISDNKDVLHKRAEWLIHKVNFPFKSMPYYDVVV